MLRVFTIIAVGALVAGRADARLWESVAQTEARYGPTLQNTIHDVEGRFDDWTLTVEHSAMKRDAKDIVESKLDCVQHGQVGVAIEGSLSLIFGLLEQANKLFDVRFIEDSTRLPNQQVEVWVEGNARPKPEFHILKIKLAENVSDGQPLLSLFEIARLLVRLDHVACVIVNMDHDVM